MTEFKGTPAPWAVEVMPSGAVTVTAGQFFVAGDGCGLAIENAKLIAAAPDLLAALTKCLDLRGTLEMHGLLAEVETSIAKAIE